MVRLTPQQLDLIQQPINSRLFVEGPAGCGKTTAGVERLLHLMAAGVPASAILLYVPSRSLAAPYWKAMETPGVVAGGQVTTLTLGGLARRMVDLFWPLVAAPAGFAHPDRLPQFLTLETAQYYMAHLVRPLLEKGYFQSLTIDRNRLYSQIIDNLNKAAVVGFPHTEIGWRLQAASLGDGDQPRLHADAQHCASLFRSYCLEHNLLDFSLQVEVFLNCLWTEPLCRDYLVNTYQHLIIDNIEEDTPASHDLLRDWLPHTRSALLIYDTQAGYRRFLGADPDSGYALKDVCPVTSRLENTFVNTPALAALGEALGSATLGAVLAIDGKTPPASPPAAPGFLQGCLVVERDTVLRFYPQMLDRAADQASELVHGQGVPPGEIVILAPYLSDALRHSLVERLQARGVPARSHRPSRSLREEPPVQCLLTLAQIAHPEWGFVPPHFDLACALVQAVDELDPVRAGLLAEIVYRVKDGRPALTSYLKIKSGVAERITARMGMRYERLRQWLEGYAQSPQAELDHFFSRLFGEVLSQPGFRFHASYQSGEAAANLIESVQKFRLIAGEQLAAEGVAVGKEFLLMLQEGVIAAQYLRSWEAPAEDAVLVAPAYTFLMSNRPVEVQFWLDLGSRAWAERLYQPLTHPYVLSRLWTSGKPWTFLDEEAANRQSLYRLALGLVRRCRGTIYLGFSELNEQGSEERGPLLHAIQRIFRNTSAEAA